MEACERLMLQGRAQFLLGHHHPAVETLLTPKQFLSQRVGDDVLIPVAAPAHVDQPDAGALFELPGAEKSVDPQHLPRPHRDRLHRRPRSNFGGPST